MDDRSLDPASIVEFYLYVLIMFLKLELWYQKHNPMTILITMATII